MGYLPPSTSFGFSHLLDLPHRLLRPLLLLSTVTWPWLGTCMSVAPERDGDLEPSCTLGDLRISITGPASQATELLRYITLREPSAAGSESSYTVVTDLPAAPVVLPTPKAAPSPRAGLPGGETRDQILATFPDCPPAWLQGHQKLTGSTRTGADRIRRAWRAGQWARSGAYTKPVPTAGSQEPLLLCAFCSWVACSYSVQLRWLLLVSHW